MPSPPPERRRWLRRCLLPAALCALAPKCLLCLAAYAGLGAALGLPLARGELCGASASSAWTFAPVALGAAAAAALGWRARRRRPTGP